MPESDTPADTVYRLECRDCDWVGEADDETEAKDKQFSHELANSHSTDRTEVEE